MSDSKYTMTLYMHWANMAPLARKDCISGAETEVDPGSSHHKALMELSQHINEPAPSSSEVMGHLMDLMP